MSNKPHWSSKVPQRCEICRKPIVEAFYDARTKGGPWAYMCTACFELHTWGVTGFGLGQRYELHGDGKFYKTEG